MVAKPRTQTLTDFQANGVETLERINTTGEVEMLTVDGQTRGVLLSPAVYNELSESIEQARHLASLRKGVEQLQNGETVTLEEMSNTLRAKLLEMKAERESAS